MTDQPCNDTIHLDTNNPLVQATYRCNRGTVEHAIHCATLTLGLETEVVIHWFSPARPVTP